MDLFANWIAALVERHSSSLSRPELLRAIRALSARYVERRAELDRRSPTDSAGKRAAFAAFYAPLHFLTVRGIVREVDAAGAGVDRLIDLGCGTGVAGAAWALALPGPAPIRGVDREGWPLDEARWNWRQLGLRGRTQRGDLVAAAHELVARRTRREAGGAGLVLGWSVNELDRAARAALLPSLLGAADQGASVLVVEPIARSAVPWWDEWASAFAGAGGRADEWRLPADLPPILLDLDRSAGFDRQELAARSLWVTAASPPHPA